MNKKKPSNNVSIITLIILGLMLASFLITPFLQGKPEVTLDYSKFTKELEANNIKSLKVEEEIKGYNVQGEFKKDYTLNKEEQKNSSLTVDKTKYFNVIVPDSGPVFDKIEKQIEKNNLQVVYKKYAPPVDYISIAMAILFGISIIWTIMFFKNTFKQQGKAMDFANSAAKKVIDSPVKFADVAGYEEEKQELIEIVDFLKNPLIYTQMGARVPKGILLVGPPGTGKTLLAKATAGEAGVNFITQSGSEFVEMFVGVGASRARKLFADAKKNAPCIVFIDEIDAIGRRRGNGMGGGNDEKEQTLNQILIEMDGFMPNSGVVVVAATNRVDVLDPALLRPGRFDRQVRVNLPNLKEREAILKLHSSKRKFSKKVNIAEMAKNTAGFSGAELENVVNESAIIAVRGKKKLIDNDDISEGIDRVMMGPAKKTRKYTKEDKNLIAYHETGHAVVGLELDDADKVQKITIIPRGDAGGYTSFSPKEDKFNYSKKDLEEKIMGLLGGRAAEEVFCNTQTAGASNDLERATKIARSMVVQYGMSDLGLYQYMMNEDDQIGYVTQRYSDEMAYKIDNEIKNILDRCYARAKEILNERKDDAKLIAEALIERETIEKVEIDYLIEHRELPPEDEVERYTEEEVDEIRKTEQLMKEKVNEMKEAQKNNKSNKKKKNKEAKMEKKIKNKDKIDETKVDKIESEDKVKTNQEKIEGKNKSDETNNKNEDK